MATHEERETLPIGNDSTATQSGTRKQNSRTHILSAKNRIVSTAQKVEREKNTKFLKKLQIEKRANE